MRRLVPSPSGFLPEKGAILVPDGSDHSPALMDAAADLWIRMIYSCPIDPQTVATLNRLLNRLDGLALVVDSVASYAKADANALVVVETAPFSTVAPGPPAALATPRRVTNRGQRP